MPGTPHAQAVVIGRSVRDHVAQAMQEAETDLAAEPIAVALEDVRTALEDLNQCPGDKPNKLVSRRGLLVTSSVVCQQASSLASPGLAGKLIGAAQQLDAAVAKGEGCS